MPGGGETKATKYGSDDIRYWGVINWGFIATTKRSKKLSYWDNVLKNGCFYHYYAYLILAGQRISPEERENCWHYKEIKKTHDLQQIAEKAKTEYELSAKLLSEECKKTGRDIHSTKRCGYYGKL